MNTTSKHLNPGLSATPPLQERHSVARWPILCWATAGVLMTCFSAWVFGHWLMSSAQFAPVPVASGDAFSPAAILRLHAVEVISSLVAVWALFHYLLRPWIKTGRPRIEGLLLIGALITYVLDTTINYRAYVMAWNTHAINFGTWAAFFPGHTGPTRYAEALFWGPPMYVYFGVILGGIQLACIKFLRPRIGLVAACVLAFMVAFGFDVVAESSIIRTGAYAWPRVIGVLTLWPGTQFQFPLYESLFVAIYASAYAVLIASARKHGQSFIERGDGRLSAALRTPTRLMAATGFASLCTIVYFGGFFLFSQHADIVLKLPSYLQAAG